MNTKKISNNLKQYEKADGLIFYIFFLFTSFSHKTTSFLKAKDTNNIYNIHYVPFCVCAKYCLLKYIC